MAEDVSSHSAEITQLLHAWRSGNAEAENRLFELVYSDLQRLAHYRLSRERKDHPLQTTELVDQIYFRLVSAKDRDWQGRQHFFAIAGRAMRHYLIDLGRGREGAEPVALDHLENLLPASSKKIDFAITVGKLLDELELANPTWCSLVEMKFFLGLTDGEAAEVLGIKLRSMQRMWHEARKWLYERVEPDSGEPVTHRRSRGHSG